MESYVPNLLEDIEVSLSGMSFLSAAMLECVDVPSHVLVKGEYSDFWTVSLNKLLAMSFVV